MSDGFGENFMGLKNRIVLKDLGVFSLENYNEGFRVKSNFQENKIGKL